MTVYRRVYDSRHLPRTGIIYGTLRSVIEYGLPFLLAELWKTHLKTDIYLGTGLKGAQA